MMNFEKILGKHSKKIILGASVLLLVLLIGPLRFTFVGGWEVNSYATQARVQGALLDPGWTPTSPRQWEYDWDHHQYGAPDLRVEVGLDPTHVNKYFRPSDSSQPAYPVIEKTVGEKKYLYDVHLYTQDITLRVDADYWRQVDVGSNTIKSETSYSKDRPGDSGSHTYYVRFRFAINRWERFIDEETSWAGVMSIFSYKNPTVGSQQFNAAERPDGYKYDDYTQIVHNPIGASQGHALNMFYVNGNQFNDLDPNGLAPDTRIPDQVDFELGVEFRSGAVLGKDGWGNVEDIYPIDPYAIFHVAFEVMTIHQYSLESEPTPITQETPAPSGDPGTSEYETSYLSRIGDAIRDFGNFFKDMVDKILPWDNLFLTVGVVVVVIGGVLILRKRK